MYRNTFFLFRDTLTTCDVLPRCGGHLPCVPNTEEFKRGFRGKIVVVGASVVDNIENKSVIGRVMYYFERI